MHNTVKNLIYIEELIKSKANHHKLPKIIAVSKTFPIENVLPLIDTWPASLWRKQSSRSSR